MCGIFGYVGKTTNVSLMVLTGLKTLEYRGYDSFGIAIGQDESFLVEKHPGKIKKINLKFKDSQIGIGHTRWATHGGVTKENAHPHLDCSGKIAAVHNGIIENFEELKKELIAKGHKFKSETDTEVVGHLIEEYLKKENFEQSVKNAFNKLQGLNAIVVVYAKSLEIVAAKTGSPLIAGLNKDGMFISSDASGIVKHTKKVVFLEDNQMVVLGKKFKMINLITNKEIKPKFTNLDWKFEDSDKGKYKHFLLKEIYDQPKVIRNIALNFDEQVTKFSKLIDSAYGTFMLGCGSASYAALSGVYLFSKIAKKHVNFSIGSEFDYIEDYLTSKSLVIPISQSGETMDIVGPIEKAKKRNAKIAALVNVLGSTLYRQSDEKVLLMAGQEKAVVGTKTFIAMFSVLFLTAYTLAKKKALGKKLLLAAQISTEKILEQKSIFKIKALAKKLKNKEHIYILGRGISYAAALEASLKLKEASYIHAEGFAAGELKHGVIALIEKQTPCFVLCPSDETFDEIISNAWEVKARGGYIIGVGPINNKVFDVFLETDDLKEATFIPQIVTFQLLAYYLALSRGLKDPDRPRNLAKSVTVK
ncbi:MAG: glutamine--fructose-6-phosphate transaminase (isomerizing) [Patescibacteria group bacterium]